MNRLGVIFNPAARGEKSQRVLDFLAAKAARDSCVTLCPTGRTGDATALAARAAADGCELVVAAGGDGTINEVVNGIAGTNVLLGILPAGTVNVFARELGIPTDLDAAWRAIEHGATRTIDLGCVESRARSPVGDGLPPCARRFFVQLAGIGLDAVSVLATNWEMKKRIGPLSYVWAGLKTIASHRAEVEVEGGRRARGGLVLVGNGRLYGGRFAVFPHARLDDGLLDVCVFQRGGYWHVMRYLQGIMRGVHTDLPDVTYFQAERFRCTASEAVPFQVEGEVAGEVPAEFRVVPKSLRVRVPT